MKIFYKEIIREWINREGSNWIKRNYIWKPKYFPELLKKIMRHTCTFLSIQKVLQNKIDLLFSYSLIKLINNPLPSIIIPIWLCCSRPVGTNLPAVIKWKLTSLKYQTWQLQNTKITHKLIFIHYLLQIWGPVFMVNFLLLLIIIPSPLPWYWNIYWNMHIMA